MENVFTADMQVTFNRPSRWLHILVLMATGRAMTLAFIHRAGEGGVGDPPAVWLMPLIGDAAIGLTAPLVAFALITRPSPRSWIIGVVWTSIAAFDALAAWLVEVSAPWPDFFMLEVFGRSMFPAAAAMHIAILALLLGHRVRARHRVNFAEPVGQLAA